MQFEEEKHALETKVSASSLSPLPLLTWCSSDADFRPQIENLQDDIAAAKTALEECKENKVGCLSNRVARLDWDLALPSILPPLPVVSHNVLKHPSQTKLEALVTELKATVDVRQPRSSLTLATDHTHLIPTLAIAFTHPPSHSPQPLLMHLPPPSLVMPRRRSRSPRLPWRMRRCRTRLRRFGYICV